MVSDHDSGNMDTKFSRLLRELKSLGLPPDDFAVFGSGPMVIRGMREPHDLDVLARGEAWDICKSKSEPRKAVSGGEVCEFADGDVEVFSSWAPGEWDTDELIDTAETIDGIRFVRLEHVLEWKRRMGREKDTRDIAIIEEYLSRQSGSE